MQNFFMDGEQGTMEPGKTENLKKKRDPGKIIEVLFKISEAVGSTDNLDELYKVIHKGLDEILNVNHFYIALYDEEKDSISFPFHVEEKGKASEDLLDFRSALSYIKRVIQNRKSIIFYEADVPKEDAETRQKASGTLGKIRMGAPLMINERVKGTILIQNDRSARDYEKEDLALLNSISRHIALAIERKESEEQLAKHRRMLEKILKSLPVGIALVQNRIFKWVNHEMPLLFGYESTLDFENHSTRMIYSNDEDYERVGQNIYQSVITGRTADYEIDLVKKDHTLFPVHIRLNSRDDENPMAWTIATFTDISQRKAGEKEKFEKEKLQGVLEMAGAVCHEINQPLQAILGYSELLLMGLESGPMEKKALHSIKSQTARLDKITGKLSGITHYRTVDYPGNTKIIDIWGVGKDMEH
jgi:PAS domain-containing protein